MQIQRNGGLCIAFCTTCKSRIDHLKQTLPQNLKDNEDSPNAKFIVLGYDDAELVEYAKSFKDDRVVFYNHPTTENFHISHAKNMAARCAILEGADILITVDADNFTGKGFAKLIEQEFLSTTRNPWMFMCPDFSYMQTLRGTTDWPGRGFAGRLAIRAQDFIKAGGYCETFDTWRGEDMDLIARLTRMGYEIRHIPLQYLKAIPHSAEVRFKFYPHARKLYENNQQLAVINSRTETVVNNGLFGMGVVHRINDSTTTSFNRVPTRIFGIGMHKTSTTSLHHAFEILKLDSFHWGKGEAAIIWQDLYSSNHSKTLEKWYALSDLPIPLLYKKLDAGYPGSKFVLTVRDEQKWLKSVERLWDPKYNPTRWVWDVHPFTNRIHRELYGRTDFDPETFLARYRQHNQEVIDYFKGRPNDLLVMDMDANAGWNELCEFLHLPISEVDYPNSYQTKLLSAEESVAVLSSSMRRTSGSFGVIEDVDFENASKEVSTFRRWLKNPRSSY